MKYICLLFVLALSLSSYAQEGKFENFMPDIANSIGGSVQKFNGLNNRIASFPQYKKLPDYAATLELGWRKEHKRVITAGGLNAGSSMGADHNSKSSTIRFFGAHVDIGYNLLKSDKVMLYPLGGLGLERYQARFFRDNSGTDFNDVLQSTTVQNNLGPLQFTNNFFTYRLGVGVSVKCPKMPASSIGLQAGYTGSFKSNAWRSNDGQSLQNAPEDKLSRVYFGLVAIFKPMFMMKH